VPVKISLGKQVSCALSPDGEIKCWGLNENGQLGYGDTNNRGDESNEMGNFLPVIDLGDGQKAVDVQSHRHDGAVTCALLLDGNLKCWGGNLGADAETNSVKHNGSLGNGSRNESIGDEPGEMGDA